MESERVVRELWLRIQAQDWKGTADLLSPDLRVEWPASSEVFLGPANFIAVQSEYPPGWSITVLSILAKGRDVVSQVEVAHDAMGATFRSAGFWTVDGGLITSGTEYWVTVGSEEPPEWRRRYSAG